MSELRGVVDDVLGPHFGAGSDELWATVSRLDWPLVGVPESAGGAGGDLSDVAELAAGIGRHAALIPLIETSLAAWLLAEVGLPVALAAGGAVVVAVPDGAAEVVGDAMHLSAVRYLPVVGTVLVVDGERVIALDTVDAKQTVEDGTLADEPVGSMTFDDHEIDASRVAPVDAATLTCFDTRTAILEAAALAGAIERAVALVVEHVATRRQFGKPLAAHQAVAHLVADLACEREATAVALQAALARPELAAAARAGAARSAGVVATGAHQLLGAMGITREHPLQLVTRRLWAWRDAGHTQRWHEEQLGRSVVAGSDDDALWALTGG